ncbi:hypothetical protein [Phaeocystidibacter luteus]|uniref:Uncharacterized protein n=1 Tax=Phaeocystidibacter luteus TaxID=911197 RepID=A0A6N6RM09_9FLAO|nr:hypothetical protein [Phaeocystidibacter luteus]KAB2814578.1 hypothetical protein F8C67_02225 [Phaeocystidibacter luteus]
MGAKKNTFYCKKHSGDAAFSIEEWNHALEECNRLGIEGEERDRILHPELFTCDVQCFDCLAEVGKTRKRTQKLLQPHAAGDEADNNLIL